MPRTAEARLINYWGKINESTFLVSAIVRNLSLSQKPHIQNKFLISPATQAGCRPLNFALALSLAIL